MLVLVWAAANYKLGDGWPHGHSEEVAGQAKRRRRCCVDDHAPEAMMSAAGDDGEEPPHARVPGGVGTLARFEFKYPLLWYHSQFNWPPSVQRETLRALQAARSPSESRLSCPGRSGSVLVPAAGGRLVEQKLAMLAPRAAAAYFRRLIEPHAVRRLQALVRGWLVRRQRRPLRRVHLRLRGSGSNAPSATEAC